MPKVIRNAPVLLVRDVVASANYYRDTLGFAHYNLWGNPPNFCIASRDAASVMFALAEDIALIRPHWKYVNNLWNVYFWVDEVVSLYEEFKASGAKIDYELGEKPYGCLEFGVQDIDGYDLGFGQRIGD